MARVNNIFERADQVDDTFAVSAADRRVVVGETAKGGDNALELHEFLEAVVMLAFARANPKFGQVGHNASAAFPLPGCLETLLKKHLLTKAKTDTLAKVKKMIEKDPEVQLVLRPRRAALKREFEKGAKSDSTMVAGGDDTLCMSMDKFCDELFERKVTRDIMVDPTPIVQGQPLPKRHSNLSWLDAKGAFVTCQSADASDGSQTV